MAPAIDLHLTLRDPSRQRTADILLHTDTESTVDDVVRSLGSYSPGPFFIGQQALRGDTPVGTSGLRSGRIIDVGKPAEEAMHAALEVVIVGGSLAGRRIPFTAAAITIGRAVEADLQVFGPSKSGSLLHLRRGRDKRVMIDPSEANIPVWVGGQRVKKPTEISLFEVVRVGNTLFEIRPAPKMDADIEPNDQCEVVFNRGSRILPDKQPPSVEVPTKPTKANKQSIPWIVIFAPLVVSGAAAYFFHSYIFLVMSGLSPIIGITSVVNSRRDAKRRLKEDTATYEARMETVKAELADWSHSESLKGRFLRPDAVTIHDIATMPRRRLWERRFFDDDFLVLRLGSNHRRLNNALRMRPGDDAEDITPVIRDDPFAVNLRQIGVLGVAGPSQRTRAVVRWLIGQMAVLHSPNDLRFVVVDGSESASAERWMWMRWLPHTSGTGDSDGAFTLIGTDRASRDERLKALGRELSNRKRLREEDEPVGREIVVVLDGARALRNLSGVAKLLREGPAVGIYAIAIDDEVSRLPAEIQAEVNLAGENSGSGSVRIANSDVVADAVIDSVDSQWADDVARSLAPIVAAGIDEDGRLLPATVRLVDLLELDLQDVDSLSSQWSSMLRSTSALVGVGEHGPFSIDLKDDGPHTLVAGTTGSGKSELLQTLVTSLALANRPDALNFLLIDYKGGSAFADAAELPHTVGLVTNLDGHLTQRALVALDAELKRREHALKEMRAADVDAAWEKDATEAATRRLPRLVIVIDEFAELVHELPDFVTGLIRVARVGRSLGVHLVLATQRPTGVVSAEMRANTNLRIALRMVDKADSSEVIEKNDAALIPRSIPGRGFARLGAGATLVSFQAARVAGRIPGLKIGIPESKATVLKFTDMGRPLRGTYRSEVLQNDARDLHAIVSLAQRAAIASNTPVQQSPWLPALASTYTLPDGHGTKINGAFGYALEDFPAEQDQRIAMYNPETDSHLLVAGSPQSGRSTVLLTIAGALAETWTPNDCHIYGLDFGNGALKSLESLRHTGGVVTRLETRRIQQMLLRMNEEVVHRQSTLSRMGVRDIAEQRRVAPDGEALPYVLILLDRWEGLMTEFPADEGSDVPETIMRMLREGPGVGVRVVMTGDRSVLRDRVFSQFDEKILLHMNDKDDFTQVGIRASNVPEHMPPGRGMRVKGVTDLQFAMLPGGLSDSALQTRWNEINTRWADTPEVVRPFRVDALPSVITRDSVKALPLEASRTQSAFDMVVGVGGDELSQLSIDVVSEGPYFVVAGPPKSGRSTALVGMVKSLLEHRRRVLAITPRLSPLQNLDDPNLVVDDGSTQLEDLLEKVDPNEDGFIVVLDDVELTSSTQLGMELRQLVKSRTRTMGVIVAGPFDEIRNELMGVLADARKTKVGIIFSPQSSLDGDIVGIRLPRSLMGRTSAGEGYLVRHGDVMSIRTPIDS